MSARWIEIRTLYHWELRSALRDRTIIVNSIVLPLVLYPVMLWAMFTGITFVRGQTDDLVSRVSLVGLPARHADLGRQFAKDDRFRIVEVPGRGDDLAVRVRRGDIDAAVVFDAAAGPLPDNFVARLVYDESRERSAAARTRVTRVLEAYRERWLRDEGRRRGVAPAAWTGFSVQGRNTASSRDMGALVLGIMLPLFFVVMVALGCLYPAIDATAGERERGTWETLMTTAAARTSIVTAKYLGVATLGGLAGLLNVAAMLLTLRGVLAPLLGAEGDAVAFAVSPSALPVLVVSAVLLAGFLAAGMMVLAAFARTFREGQSMVTPFYLSALLPIMFLSTPDIRLTVPLALVPVVNVALAVREALNAVFKPLELLIALTATLAAIALLLRLATLIVAVESVLVGSYAGGLATFVRDRLRRGAAGSGTRTP